MKINLHHLVAGFGFLLAGGLPAAAQLIPPLPQIPRTNVTDQAATEGSLQTSTQLTTAGISARVAETLRPVGGATPAQQAFLLPAGGLELTAGYLALPDAGRWTAWGRAATSWLDDDYADTALNGRIHTPLLGVDQARDGTVLGLSVGYEGIDLSTKFNNGSLTADGVSFIPYIGTLLTDDLVLDGGLGYSRLRYHRRDNRGTAAASRRRFDADRLIAFTTLTGYAPPSWLGDGIGLSGNAGLSWSLESQEGSTDSSGRDIDGGLNRLGRLTLGLRLDGKPALADDGTPGFAPLASLTYQFDFVQSNDTELTETERPRDRSDLLATLGFSVGLTPSALLTVEYSRLFARRKFDSQSLLLGTRLSF